MYPAVIASALLLLLSAASALTLDESILFDRGLPADATGVKSITSPGGASIRYKEPGLCETTPGVNSYAGYVDLDEETHMFFWFFEARHDPANAPLTLWLNGGPGADSLIGLFQELGPCNITADLKSQLNPYSWNEISNLIFLSQPIGTGFSYSDEVVKNGGRFADVNISAAVFTTQQAAVGAWHVLQGFLASLPQLDSEVESRTFNLWTESYGGHYGPSFFSYFYEQNLAIANGTQNGTQLVMDTLGIGNGIIDEGVQVPYYPEFAVNNTYGIKAVSDTIYQEMKDAYYSPGMCRDKLADCAAANRSSNLGFEICQLATSVCRNQVEIPYYTYSGRGVYDIRHPSNDPTPPSSFIDYLNQASVQQAIGVNLNYTVDTYESADVDNDFVQSGDFVYPDFKRELEALLEKGVRVALYYGDADYICNWFGGQAISLALNYSNSASFAAAPYLPFLVNGTEYGSVRQSHNLSFLRVYESGHEVPYYQPVAALEHFRRVLAGKAVADGGALGSDGGAGGGGAGASSATHTECFVALPTQTGQTSACVVSGAASTATATTTMLPSSSTAVGTAAVSSPSASWGERRVRLPWQWRGR